MKGGDRHHEWGDTRRLGRRIIGSFTHSIPASLTKILVCLVVTGLVSFLAASGIISSDEPLSRAGVNMLAILVLAAGLWVTEAIPAFAVSLLVIALEIAILGRPGTILGQDPSDPKAWETFIKPWSSPLIWLFLGGFVLAHAAVQTGLDLIIARRILKLFGTRPRRLLLGVMTVTFFLSMFMSNTATAAMMLALLGPVLAGLELRDPYTKALGLGVAMAASVGGMGTIIGTPPNAIAAQALQETYPVSFMSWISIGLPPAFILFLVSWGFLVIRYPADQDRIPTEVLNRPDSVSSGSRKPHLVVVLVVFILVIGMWLFESIHKIPAPVIAFFGIAILSVTGVVTADGVRKLPWDVLLLMAGGLSLGVGVQETGLAQWLVSFVPDGLSEAGLILFFSILAVAMSNFMSNTATASILIPVVSGFGSHMPQTLVLPVALVCSCAMVLPVSTPPNAVAFASGHLKPGDFVQGGIIMALIGPLVVYAWMLIRF